MYKRLCSASKRTGQPKIRSCSLMSGGRRCAKVTRRSRNATPVAARTCSTNTAKQYSAYGRDTPAGPLSPADVERHRIAGLVDRERTAVLISGK